MVTGDDGGAIKYVGLLNFYHCQSVTLLDTDP
jgi:hypothetical protein